MLWLLGVLLMLEELHSEVVNNSPSSTFSICTPNSVSQPSHCCDKCREKLFERRKDLFWLTVSLVSVDESIAPLLRSCGEAECHGFRKMWWRKLLTSWQPGSRVSKQKGARDKVYLSRTCLQWPDSPNKFPSFIVSHLPIVYSESESISRSILW
jgi:hypothetical protein